MTKRKTKQLAISKDHHEAMQEFFNKHKVPMKFQAEAGIEEFLRKRDPKIYDKLIKKTKQN